MSHDMKEALSGTVSKPDITHVRRPLKVYVARACEYGSEKYERANFLRNCDERAATRLRVYLRATIDHLQKVADAMEDTQAVDPGVTELTADALAVVDLEAGANFPASGLPHLAHAAASLNMLITIGVKMGVLPEDPGQPWREREPSQRELDEALERETGPCGALDCTACAVDESPKISAVSVNFDGTGEPWAPKPWLDKPDRT